MNKNINTQTIFTISIDGKDLKIKLEKNNERRVSLWMEYDNSIIYSTLVISDKKEDRNTNFTVFYKEMSYANSKNFFKKESNKTDKEILISRTIDRSIRPFLRNVSDLDLTLTVMLLQGHSNLDITLWSGFFLLQSLLKDGENLGCPYAKTLHFKEKESLTVALNKDGFIMMEGTFKKLEKTEILKVLTQLIEEQKSFSACYEQIPFFQLLTLRLGIIPNKEMGETYGRKDRDWLDIRPLHIEINPLHQSNVDSSKRQTNVLFQRGETKVLVVLGLCQSDIPEIQLFYRFHPFSVNESGETYGNSRREKGHGYFAKHCLDSYWKQGLSYKIISDVLSCNGSSSMATVCGASLSMALEYGEELISGITGGKIGNNYIIDLEAQEDDWSICDLKVVSNEQGLICGVFMDTKQMVSLGDVDILLDKIIDSNRKIIQYMKSKIQINSTLMQIKQSKIGVFLGKNGIHIKDMQKILKCNLKVFDAGYITLSTENKLHFTIAQEIISSFNTLENNQQITAIIRGIKVNETSEETKTININLGLLNFNIDWIPDIQFTVGDIVRGTIIIENNKITLINMVKVQI